MRDSSISQVNNWHNFCQYHLGNWHGIWFEYSLTGKIIKSFRCVRSFRLSEDGNLIYHQNHYTYADGKTETKSFGPYQKPVLKSLFLDNSFSWGSQQVEPGSKFGFETGFRYEEKRTSLAVLYDGNGSLAKIVAIAENLDNFAKITDLPPAQQLSHEWQGTIKKMTPDWIISPTETTSWQQLADLNKNYLTWYLTNGISLGCPPQVTSGEEFFLAIDWLVNPDLLHRGIRHFDTSGFTCLTLEVFSRNSN